MNSRQFCLVQDKLRKEKTWPRDWLVIRGLMVYGQVSLLQLHKVSGRLQRFSSGGGTNRQFPSFIRNF